MTTEQPGDTGQVGDPVPTSASPPPTDAPTSASPAPTDVATEAQRPDPVDGSERTLDPRVVTVWRVSTALSTFVPTVVLTGIAVAVFGALGWIVAGVGLVLTVALTLWYPRAAYDRWRWRLTELAVELDHGVVVRQHEALPYFRIQQIDVTQGPIDRLLKLASLQVTSASASGSASLPGLPASEAPEVRRVLLRRAAAAVGEHQGEVRDAV